MPGYYPVATFTFSGSEVKSVVYVLFCFLFCCFVAVVLVVVLVLLGVVCLVIVAVMACHHFYDH